MEIIRKFLKFIDRIILKLIASGPTIQPETFTFENLDDTNRMTVTTNLNRMITAVNDTAVIEAALEFIKRHPTGWIVPFEGVPVAKLQLNFYADDKILGSLGVEPEFLTIHQAGSFWSKTVDESERAKILAIIGQKDYDQD